MIARFCIVTLEGRFRILKFLVLRVKVMLIQELIDLQAVTSDNLICLDYLCESKNSGHSMNNLSKSQVINKNIHNNQRKSYDIVSRLVTVLLFKEKG